MILCDQLPPNEAYVAQERSESVAKKMITIMYHVSYHMLGYNMSQLEIYILLLTYMNNSKTFLSALLIRALSIQSDIMLLRIRIVTSFPPRLKAIPFSF